MTSNENTFRKMLFAGWLMAFVVVVNAAVLASDLHVDPTNGEDAHDGAAQPVKTIARAIRLAQPGDTIHLRPVTYRD